MTSGNSTILTSGKSKGGIKICLDLEIKKENDGLTIKETILSFELPQINEVIEEFEEKRGR